jgi:hypothetical protein
LYRDGSVHEMLDARVVLLSLLSSELVSEFDVNVDSDSSSSKMVSRPWHTYGGSQPVVSTGAVVVGFDSSGLLRVSGRRPFEFGGLAIPDRSTVAIDFTVRFERSDVFVLGLGAETETLGTRDASIGRLDRLLVIFVSSMWYVVIRFVC